MRAVDNYLEAEERLELARKAQSRGDEQAQLCYAQVHATLALAGATALQSYARIDGTDRELARLGRRSRWRGMTEPIPNKPSHVIEQADAAAWLAAYGLDINEVAEAVIRLGYDPGTRAVGAWLDATWYKLNAEGGRYFEAGIHSDEAATGSSTIPLSSFPLLTQLPGSSP